MNEQEQNSPILAAAVDKHQVMTIDKAKELYSRFGSEMKQDYSSVANLIRHAGVDEALSNSNYLHALAYTDLMMGHTQQSFRMLTGCAGAGFIGCLKEQFVSMLQRLRSNGQKARVILVNSDSVSPLDDLGSEFRETLQFQQATAAMDNSVQHFIVCDGDMVRIEYPHEKLVGTDSADVIRADVYFKNPSRASALSGTFDAIWNRLLKPE